MLPQYSKSDNNLKDNTVRGDTHKNTSLEKTKMH